MFQQILDYNQVAFLIIKMKFIIYIVCFLVFLNCNEKSNLENRPVEIVDSVEVSTEYKQSEDKIIDDPITGEYYSTDFGGYLHNGFEIKVSKPTDGSFTIHKIQFKKDGKVIVEDLTLVYLCGNGILKIDEGRWKSLTDNRYQLEFEGEYSFEEKFNTISLYEMSKLKDGTIKMKLIEVKQNKRYQPW